MDKFIYKEVIVKVYTDVHEFAFTFYALPEDAVLDLQSLPNDAGFSCVETNTISIYKDDACKFDELLRTVSHEMGHLVTGGFKENPPQDEKYDDLHEEKAEHYESFTMDSYNIAKIIHENSFKGMDLVQFYKPEPGICRICGGQMESTESGMCDTCWCMYDMQGV